MKNKQEDFTVKLLPFVISQNYRGNKIKNKDEYALNMIKAKSMWEVSNQGEGVKIAVIDSGCDINHKNLKGSIVDKRNFTDEDDKNTVIDRVGHGTHVIGTIVANGKDNTPMGIAPKSKIYALKAIDKTGSGKVSWVVNAIYYAIDKKVDIISMSLGMSQSTKSLEKAIKEAIDKDILVVCAAGNDGDGNANDFEYSYPAAYKEVISVGAVDKKGVPAIFSNANLNIDVVAPGVDIVSTYPGNTFNTISGTSMATPHVSGSLALLKNWSSKEFQRNLSEAELYAQLIKHTKFLKYSRTVQGNGLIYLSINNTKVRNIY